MENENLNKAVCVLQDALKYMKINDVRIDSIEFKIGSDFFKAGMPKNYTVSYNLEMNGEHIRMAEGNTLCRGDGRCYECGHCL
ncbi:MULTISPECIES: hypothetical protein [unclassified Lacrimispora]|uniref:hypothetical protein n=1 Tax=unclassified Lacrimispora TaxID=2719232 RepID=UPI00376FC72E